MFAKLLSTFDYLSLSACGFDLLACGFRKAMSANGQGFFDLAVSEDFDAVMDVVRDKTALLKRGEIDDGSGCKSIKLGEIQDVEDFAEDVGESALGESALKGHLAPFEAGMRGGACASVLAFVAKACGFSKTRTYATSDALCFFDSAFGGAKRGKGMLSHD